MKRAPLPTFDCSALDLLALHRPSGRGGAKPGCDPGDWREVGGVDPLGYPPSGHVMSGGACSATSVWGGYSGFDPAFPRRPAKGLSGRAVTPTRIRLSCAVFGLILAAYRGMEEQTVHSLQPATWRDTQREAGVVGGRRDASRRSRPRQKLPGPAGVLRAWPRIVTVGQDLGRGPVDTPRSDGRQADGEVRAARRSGWKARWTRADLRGTARSPPPDATPIWADSSGTRRPAVPTRRSRRRSRCRCCGRCRPIRACGPRPSPHTTPRSHAGARLVPAPRCGDLAAAPTACSRSTPSVILRRCSPARLPTPLDPQPHTRAVISARRSRTRHRRLVRARCPVPEAPAAQHRLGLRRRAAGRADRTPRGQLGGPGAGECTTWRDDPTHAA